MGGSLAREETTRLRAATLVDAEWLSPGEIEEVGASVERVATVGLEGAYREAQQPQAATLDQIVVSVFLGEELKPELHPVGHLDPWGWNSIEALVLSLGPKSPARLLLTGRRPAVSTTPDPSSGNAYVIFTPHEASLLATDLGSAMRSAPGRALANWEVEQFTVAMAELAAEAGRGRGVFAHYG